MGAIAGCTIFVGLPIGRLRAPMPRTRALLNSLAIGILVFLLWDVLAHSWAPVNSAIEGRRYGPALREGLGLAVGTGRGAVGPVCVARRRARLLGLIGGGPTFVGTVIGQRFTDQTLSVAFLSLAAGSILYVVIELLAVGRKFNAKSVTTWGLLAGLLLGFATDAIVTAAGA